MKVKRYGIHTRCSFHLTNKYRVNIINICVYPHCFIIMFIHPLKVRRIIPNKIAFQKTEDRRTVFPQSYTFIGLELSR